MSGDLDSNRVEAGQSVYRWRRRETARTIRSDGNPARGCNSDAGGVVKDFIGLAWSIGSASTTLTEVALGVDTFGNRMPNPAAQRLALCCVAGSGHRGEAAPAERSEAGYSGRLRGTWRRAEAKRRRRCHPSGSPRPTPSPAASDVSTSALFGCAEEVPRGVRKQGHVGLSREAT